MATSQDLPDLIAYAQTASEALENAKDVAEHLVDLYLEHGDPLGCQKGMSENWKEFTAK